MNPLSMWIMKLPLSIRTFAEETEYKVRMLALICAVSIRGNMAIYTNDKGFRHYAKHLPLELYEGNYGRAL